MSLQKSRNTWNISKRHIWNQGTRSDQYLTQPPEISEHSEKDENFSPDSGSQRFTITGGKRRFILTAEFKSMNKEAQDVVVVVQSLS